jgi:acetyltransferase-like isoleucine patch superfamily enzyme
MLLIEKIYLKLLTIIWSITVPLILRLKGVKVCKEVRFYGFPIISMIRGSTIEIKKGAVLCSDSRFTALGVNHRVILRTLSKGAKISIGENTGISGTTICSVEEVIIQDECLIGANVSIVDNDFHPIKPENRRFNSKLTDIKSSKVKIKNNVFIGMNSSILKGVEIGENSVIGANSTVVNKIADNEIWAGNPARRIKALEINKDGAI